MPGHLPGHGNGTSERAASDLERRDEEGLGDGAPVAHWWSGLLASGLLPVLHVDRVPAPPRLGGDETALGPHATSVIQILPVNQAARLTVRLSGPAAGPAAPGVQWQCVGRESLEYLLHGPVGDGLRATCLGAVVAAERRELAEQRRLWRGRVLLGPRTLQLESWLRTLLLLPDTGRVVILMPRTSGPPAAAGADPRTVLPRRAPAPDEGRPDMSQGLPTRSPGTHGGLGQPAPDQPELGPSRAARDLSGALRADVRAGTRGPTTRQGLGRRRGDTARDAARPSPRQLERHWMAQLAGAESPSEVVQVALQGLRDLAQAETAACGLLDPDTHHLTLVSSLAPRGPLPEPVALGDEAVLARAAQQARTDRDDLAAGNVTTPRTPLGTLPPRGLLASATDLTWPWTGPAHQVVGVWALAAPPPAAPPPAAPRAGSAVAPVTASVLRGSETALGDLHGVVIVWWPAGAGPRDVDRRRADRFVAVVTRALTRARAHVQDRVRRLQAEEANEEKMRFLAVMSHELRTPLNAIQGYAQLLALGIRGPVTPDQVEDLGRIEAQQRHVMDLVNDILDFARLDRGVLQYALEPVALAGVIDEVAEALAGLARRRGVQLHPLAPPAPADGGAGRAGEESVVLADPRRVRQIILNLGSNAIKATPNGGTVSFELLVQPGVVQLHVQDTGSGVPDGVRARLFTPFATAQTATEQRQAIAQGAGPNGAGLGLYLSREMARAMQGDVCCLRSDGTGTVFELRLPRVPSVALAPG